MKEFPPPSAATAALIAASESPCVKSKRGCAIWRVSEPGKVVGVGFNGRPDGRCGNACQPLSQPADVNHERIERHLEVSRCSKMAVHAEARAIRAAIASAIYNDPDDGEPDHAAVSFLLGEPVLRGYEMLHVKAEPRTLDGPIPRQPAPGHPGFEIVETAQTGWGIAVSPGPSCWQCSREIVDVGLDAMWLFHEDGWRRYPAEEFHRLTLEQAIPRDLLRSPT